ILFVARSKVNIVSQIRNGVRSSAVQAGLVLVVAITSLLSACGEQPAPVDSQPTRVASAAVVSGETADRADMPVVVVTATRSPKGEI
ncbi:MAG TPA: hypothetical protein VGO53_03955, partial [Steroidobacteraceae bacterium]|nr:hypothetical protein [Steroidobacteraceae bacterium]